MAITGDFIKGQPVEGELVVQVRANVADPPELGLAWVQHQRRIDEAVDRAYRVRADPEMHHAPVLDLNVLKEQQTLLHSAERRKRVEQSLDDERAGHAVAHLVVGMSVRMGMVPIEAG